MSGIRFLRDHDPIGARNDLGGGRGGRSEGGICFVWVHYSIDKRNEFTGKTDDLSPGPFPAREGEPAGFRIRFFQVPFLIAERNEFLALGHSGGMRYRRRQQGALLDLVTMLAGSTEAVLAQGMLTDRSADPGLFGSRSVTWRVLREPLLLLGGSRALLMQVAHPLVAQGVIDYSRYETEPYGRLLETSRWVYVYGFGTHTEAKGAVDELRRVHERVRGELGATNTTPRFGAATPYSALDADLGTWVYATLVQSMLLTHGALIGDLRAGDPDAFVREWAEAGELMDTRPAPHWRSASDLRAYVDGQIAGGAVQPVAGAARIARTVLRPPLPWPQLAPVARLAAFVTTGLLPPALRRGYGLTWTERDQQMHDAFCGVSRGAHPWLPRRARVSPLWEVAVARMSGATL